MSALDLREILNESRARDVAMTSAWHAGLKLRESTAGRCYPLVPAAAT
jgi:hypothetical protein